MTHQSFIDSTFKDKDGKWAIVQPPNWPIIFWAFFKVLGYLHISSNFKNGFEFLSTSFLFLWAYLELTSGVNYFRRVLGLAVLLGIIVSHF